MTVLGKILVFVNLVFSLAVAGLVVTVFMTRTNWRNGYEEINKEYKISEASRGAEQASYKSALEQRETEIQNKDKQIAALNNDKLALDGQIVALRADLAQRNTVANTEKTNNEAATREMDKLTNERNMLAAQKTERDQRILALEKSIVDHRNEAVSARVQANSLTEKLQKLMMEYSQVVRENGQLKASGAVPNQSFKPAPVEVKGQVTGVADNLVTVSLGSDHGLSVGTILQVYRLSPTATYLGTVTITNLETHRAAGRFTPAVRNAKVMKGDTVDTKIIGQ
ncbi:MAG TPA: hypothetical protein VGZ47_18010 [Gemmataceae bacterium]|jgi:hypothetical protein|nr:hypothetical protein [Gemmataceae bacterium]